MTAPSSVAGRPVSVQSPPRKKFRIGVSADGRRLSTPQVGENVARFSFIIIDERSFEPVIAGNALRRSSSAIDRKSAAGRSTYRWAPLMTAVTYPVVF